MVDLAERTTADEVPAGYRMTELGVLPEDWQVVPLGDVCVLQRGNDLPKEQRRDGSYPVIGSNGIAGHHAVFVDEGPGVLVGRSGSVVKVTWVDDNYWPLNTALWVKDFCGNDRRFVYYLLCSMNLAKYAAGVSVPTLNRNLVHPVAVALPPLPEQRAIAQVLSTVQRAREATEAVIAATRELKRSLMRHLFTYGPVPLDQVAGAPLKETEIGLVPEDWDVRPIGEMFEVQLGKMLSPKARAGLNPVPYLRNQDVRWGSINVTKLPLMDFDERESQKFDLRNGDVLVCEGGEIGRTAVWHGKLEPCCYQKAIHRLRSRYDDVDPHFFAYYMMHAFLLTKLYGDTGTTTTIAHLPAVKLRSLPMPVPPLSAQRDISWTLLATDAKLRAEVETLQAISTVHEVLSAHLISGRIRMSKQGLT